MEALRRFYKDVTWTGTIHEGGMGPGTPAMRGVGRATVRALQAGRWIAMAAEQAQFLEDDVDFLSVGRGQRIGFDRFGLGSHCRFRS